MYKTMIPPENLLLYLRVTIQIIIHFLGLFKENFLVNFDIFSLATIGGESPTHRRLYLSHYSVGP